MEKSPLRMACRAASNSVKMGDAGSVVLAADTPFVTAGAFDPLAVESVVRCISFLPPEILETYNAE
jgi:hypothetical protein